MQKNLFLSFLLFSSFLSLGQIVPETFTIKAFLPYWNGAVVNVNADGQKINSGVIQKDMYSFSGTLQQQKNATIEIRKNNRTYFIPFILEAGTIRVRDKGNNRLEAFGTTNNDEYLEINRRIDSLALTLQTTTLPEIKTFKRKTAADFIKNNPHSLVSLQLMNEHYYLDNAVDDTTYYTLFDLLDKDLKKTPLGKKLGNEAIVSKWTAIGVTAPNLQMLDVNNKPSTVYDKSKYTLIDFWASWCLPCKKEIPAMVALHNKYKEKNFVMVSIALDTDVFKLKKAIEKDKLEWKHLIDYKGWNSEAVKVYGVKTIPMNFLVDENGIIIAKNLTPEALDAKLAQLLGETQRAF